MSQLENNKRKSQASARTARSSQSRPSSGRGQQTSHSSSHPTGGTPRRGTSGHTRGQTRRRKRGPDYTKIVAACLVVLAVIAAIVFALNFPGEDAETVQTQAEETTQEVFELETEQDVLVDGVSIRGLTIDQAREAFLEAFPWSMTVTYGEESYSVDNLIATRLDELLTSIYGAASQEESYTLDTSGLDEEAAAAAAACAGKWDKAAKNGSIDSFDKSSGSFVFAGEEDGFAIDQASLAAQIALAAQEKQYDAVIEASGSTVSPEITAASAKEKYKTLSSLTTNTTANAKRNTNVRLAAEAIDGSVVKPGEEFSFNQTVGRRTEEKGYQAAAAYSGGEVVQEIGGGVCQVSTTLYGAVFRAGLTISVRRSHTFEPSYITPGQDATVSYDQPDFCFVNNSSTAIGIRASYSNQKMTVSIYGIPILDDGVTWDLYSTKVEDLDPPAATYEEDQTLQPGVEVTKSAGTSGSRWETYKIIYKNGVETSRELDHKTTYKGHAPVILRNTSGVVVGGTETTAAEETVQTEETTAGTDTVTVIPSQDTVIIEETRDISAGPGAATETTSAGPGTTTAAQTQAATTAAATTASDENSGPGAAVSSDGATAVIAPLSVQ